VSDLGLAARNGSTVEWRAHAMQQAHTLSSHGWFSWLTDCLTTGTAAAAAAPCAVQQQHGRPHSVTLRLLQRLAGACV
jgi:hypothetical protein